VAIGCTARIGCCHELFSIRLSALLEEVVSRFRRFQGSSGAERRLSAPGGSEPYRAVGYATDGDSPRIVNARYFLAPVLLDLDYLRHDIVLSDYTTPAKDILKTNPAYTLVAEFPQATDWARSIKIYRKVK